MPEAALLHLVERALPDHAFRSSEHSWTWTRPSGVWHLNVSRQGDDLTLKARLDGSPSVLQVVVRTTVPEVNAAIYWLVAVGAIDRHPDAPQSAQPRQR